MVYGLYLKLDQSVWSKGDFSSESKLTGTIYTDSAKTVAKNLTGYAIQIRLFEDWQEDDFFNKTAAIVVAANGTWEYAVAQNEMPDSGVYLVKAELTKSGVRESTLNRQKLTVRLAPTA